MSDHITLDALRIETGDTIGGGWGDTEYRLLTVDDLRQVLANLTPEQMEQLGADVVGMMQDDWGLQVLGYSDLFTEEDRRAEQEWLVVKL